MAGRDACEACGQLRRVRALDESLNLVPAGQRFAKLVMEYVRGGEDLLGLAELPVDIAGAVLLLTEAMRQACPPDIEFVTWLGAFLLSRYEPAVMVTVYPVPDARTGDQVMAALELSGDFDPADFAAFLGSQPDLGTKWAPRYVRLIRSMPLTGTNTVDKQPLRARQWVTSDRVFVRPDRHLFYREMSEADRAELRAEFADYERLSLLPRPAVSARPCLLVTQHHWSA